MIVRQFLQWQRTASAAERADATSALARAYLYSNLSPDDRAAAEGALLMLLDDPSPLVRAALAQALASSEQAPPTASLALAGDQAEIARAEIAPFSLDRVVERFGHLGVIREAMLDRHDLPAPTRQGLVAKLSQ